jgi:hypothetical protein
MLAGRMTSEEPKLDEVAQRTAAFAEALNCLGVLLCTTARRVVQEKMGASEFKQMLLTSADRALAFFELLLRRKGHGPGDWEASGAEFQHLKNLLCRGEIDDPEHFSKVEAALRCALTLMDMPVPDFPLGVDGAICRMHGAACPQSQAPSQ